MTKISLFWFNKLADIIPNHFVTADVNEMPGEVRQYKDQLEGRTMLVKKAQVVPLEAIVRGYITGAHLLPGLEVSGFISPRVRMVGIQEDADNSRRTD